MSCSANSAYRGFIWFNPFLVLKPLFDAAS
jgi:hypothetical protein